MLKLIDYKTLINDSLVQKVRNQIYYIKLELKYKIYLRFQIF